MYSTTMGLLRYQIFLVYGVLFLAFWLGAKTNQDETTGPAAKIFVDFGPLWALVILGLYALSTIAYNVMTFNDCPEAAAELEQQIKEAKKEMKKRGIIQ